MRTKREVLQSLLCAMDYCTISSDEGWIGAYTVWDLSRQRYQNELLAVFKLDTRFADRQTILAYLGWIDDGETAHERFTRTRLFPILRG